MIIIANQEIIEIDEKESDHDKEKLNYKDDISLTQIMTNSSDSIFNIIQQINKDKTQKSNTSK